MELYYRDYYDQTDYFLNSLVGHIIIAIPNNEDLKCKTAFIDTDLPEISYKHICDRYSDYLEIEDYIDIAHALYHMYFDVYSKHCIHSNGELRKYYKEHFYDILQDVYDHKFYNSYVLKVVIFHICSNLCQRYNNCSLLKYILVDEHVESNECEKKYLAEYVKALDINTIISQFNRYTKLICENAKVWITLDDNDESRKYWSVPLNVLKSDRKINYDNTDSSSSNSCSDDSSDDEWIDAIM